MVNPVEVIKIRLQAQIYAQSGASTKTIMISKQHNGTLETVVTMVRMEGIGSLYRGVSLTALRQGTNQAANFTMYSELKLKTLLKRHQESKQMLKNDNNNNRRSTSTEIPPYHTTIVGLIAGVVAPFCNAPIDTIKTRLQLSAAVSGESALSQVFRITSRAVRNEGFRALYKGIIPRVMRVAPGQAVTFTVYEFVKSIITGQ